MAIYLEWDGGAIKGNVTAEGYKGHDPAGFQRLAWAGHLHGSRTHIEPGEATRPTISEVTVAKNDGWHSLGLFQEALVALKARKRSFTW